MTTKIAAKGARAKANTTRAQQSSELSSSEHLYLQVARALKQEIVRGIFPVGSQLPTEEELCQRFSVSRYTVREALRRLREDNLVSSRQGAGTIVAPRPTAGAYAHDIMSINDLVAWSAGKTFAIESMEMVTLDEKLASRLGLKRGEQWLAVLGYGHMEGVKPPVCGAEYFIHKRFATVGRLLQRHNGPIFPLIEDLFGQRVVEVHQEIGATLILPALAEPLKVKAGTAGLEVRRTYVTGAGDIAQVTISTHPATRYRHSMTMRRVKG
jgi:GntR family transcriptional regulator